MRISAPDVFSAKGAKSGDGGGGSAGLRPCRGRLPALRPLMGRGALEHPATNEVGIEAVGQRHRRGRNAGRLAGGHDLGLEGIAVPATTPTGRGEIDC